ncbi:MAG: hypothetical protein LBI38_02385 [Oscillospiraceae bacterium]|jgi:rod shape-determining protein MreD|nr:hypothetical protein [Oscillospiraceae bacterium]
MSEIRLFGALGKKDRFRAVMRWFLYSLTLLLMYMAMSGGLFKKWQPVMIIPLAVSVAMREKEMSGSVFGAVCGLIIDIAYGKLFGFSGVWLMPCCLAAALLVANLIKSNLLNFLWVNAVVCALTALADYFFGYVLWNVKNSSYVLTGYIIPAHLSAVLLSPAVYFLVKLISVKFSPRETRRLNVGPAEDEEEEEYYRRDNDHEKRNNE